MIRLTVPATSANLGPGFDCLGLAISLRNSVEIKKSPFFSISISGEGANVLKAKTQNSFVKIFYEKLHALSGEKPNFRFIFKNSIPLSRGLGSSSAMIVSALAAAYMAHKISPDKDTILNEALKYENHPDNISPTVFGGFNVAVAQNGVVTKLKANISKDIKACMVIPKKPISTKKSRATLPELMPRQDAVFNLARSSLLTAAFVNQRYDLLHLASQDLMHQNLRMNLMPALFDVQKLALKNGALMSTLSGSGSSFLNVVYADAANDFCQKMSSAFGQFSVKIFDFDNYGLA